MLVIELYGIIVEDNWKLEGKKLGVKLIGIAFYKKEAKVI